MATAKNKERDKKPHPKHEKVLNGKRYKSEGALLIASGPVTPFAPAVARFLLRTPKGAYFLLTEQTSEGKEKEIMPYCWESAYQEYMRMTQEVPVEEAFPSVEVEEA